MTGTTMISDVSGPMPSVMRRHQRNIGGEHDEVAMGDIDQPHDAEDQRQPGGEHGVKPADQHALQDDVDPIHRVSEGIARNRAAADSVSRVERISSAAPA